MLVHATELHPEKFAEHLTAIDEAWDNQVDAPTRNETNRRVMLTLPQMNFALAHVLGSALQTALLNSSLVVIVGWGLSQDMVRFSGAEDKPIEANIP